MRFLKIIVLVLYFIIFNMLISIEVSDEVVTYNNSIKDSMLKINFQINRLSDFQGEGDLDVDNEFDIQGILDFYYNTRINSTIVLIISSEQKKYVYNITNEDRYIYFPLQMGSGKYKVELFENVKNYNYKKIYSEFFDVETSDDRLVHLNSIQIVDWQQNSPFVSIAKQLIKNTQKENVVALYGDDYSLVQLESYNLSSVEKVRTVYEYVLNTFEYDYNKITLLEDDYIPDINQLYENKTGICYDYSAVIAVMLRSLNIPAKLVKGYTSRSNIYHAWNEIYLEDENRWIIVDATRDEYLIEIRSPYEMEKNPETYTTSQEY